MKPIISKEPSIPVLNKEDVAYLTEIVFGPKTEQMSADAIFVFSGTHPGHFQKALEAYQAGLAKKIIVTGGRSLTSPGLIDWEKETATTEAEYIMAHLVADGVKRSDIIYEDQSTNSLENVTCALNVVDFSQINSLVVIGKAHAMGRQLRTLKKYIPQRIHCQSYPFAVVYDGVTVSRENWPASEIGRKRVWGEYLRIEHYGTIGDILSLAETGDTHEFKKEIELNEQ